MHPTQRTGWGYGYVSMGAGLGMATGLPVGGMLTELAVLDAEEGAREVVDRLRAAGLLADQRVGVELGKLVQHGGSQ